jgi:hypothetical protein
VSVKPRRNPFAIGDGRIARVQAATTCRRDRDAGDTVSLRDFTMFRPCLEAMCERCAPLFIPFEAAATFLARPEMSAVVTWDVELCGEYHGLELDEIAKTIRPKLDMITESLGLLYTSSEFLARIELAATDGRPHVHLLHSGSHIRADRLYEACIEAKLGIGMIQMIESRLGMVCYVFKTALWSLLLLPEDAQTVLEFDRELNAGEYFYATTGFFPPDVERRWPPKIDATAARVVEWVERANQRQPLWKMMPERLLDLVPLDRRGEHDS